MTSTESGPASPDPLNDHIGDEMLTIDEAAAFLRKPLGTMRWWRHCGTGPRSFLVGRNVRYWRTDLILWLAEQAARPQPGD
jgi:Helix-turn-helix domain